MRSFNADPTGVAAVAEQFNTRKSVHQEQGGAIYEQDIGGGQFAARARLLRSSRCRAIPFGAGLGAGQSAAFGWRRRSRRRLRWHRCALDLEGRADRTSVRDRHRRQLGQAGPASPGLREFRRRRARRARRPASQRGRQRCSTSTSTRRRPGASPMPVADCGPAPQRGQVRLGRSLHHFDQSPTTAAASTTARPRRSPACSIALPTGPTSTRPGARASRRRPSTKLGYRADAGAGPRVQPGAFAQPQQRARCEAAADARYRSECRGVFVPIRRMNSRSRPAAAAARPTRTSARHVATAPRSRSPGASANCGNCSSPIPTSMRHSVRRSSPALPRPARRRTRRSLPARAFRYSEAGLLQRAQLGPRHRLARVDQRQLRQFGLGQRHRQRCRTVVFHCRRDIAYGFNVSTGQLRTFLRLDNAFDRQYAGSVIINDANGRYFEPAPGRTVMLGLQWQWTL